MCTLREFDMRSRGVVNLADEWKLHHAAVRKVWNVEDVIETTNGAIEMARELYLFVVPNDCVQRKAGALGPNSLKEVEQRVRIALRL